MKYFATGLMCVCAVVAIALPTGNKEENARGIRLVGGRNAYEGRVEILYDGVWSTVCDDHTSGGESYNVMCRMLGFASADGFFCCSKFGQGSGARMFRHFYCTGDEVNVTECSYNLVWETDVSSSDSRYYCDHSEDIGLICDPGNVEVNPFDIRLIGGETPFEGRVEIYYQGSWTTVCDERIRMEEAHVLCRMLGHASASRFSCCAEFGKGIGDTLLRDIQCEGIEVNITECEFRDTPNQPGYSSSDLYGEYCDHSDDLGLVCIPGDIRLQDGSKRPGLQHGRVELRKDHTWKAICAESMNLNLAIVLCRMLGEHTAKKYYDMDFVSHGEGAVLNVTYICQGDEDDIDSCEEWSREGVNCSRGQLVAGITCISLPVRLVSSKPNEGRVEVYFGLSWSAICFTSWNIHAAEVVCRMLGYQGASEAFRDEELHEAPSVNVLLESVVCNGTERNLAHCNMSEFKRATCDLDGYAAARCIGEADVPIRLSGGTDLNSGRVELFYYGSWGTVCAAEDLSASPNPEYGINIANVVCRMLGFPRALSYECCGYYGHGVGGIYLDTLKCSGKEANILDCPQSELGVHRRCNHFMDLGVTCQKKVDYEIRLLGSPSPLEGRVEIKSEGFWGTICDDNWDLSDSNVVCRMLGYERADSFSCCAKYGKVSKRRPIILDEVECEGPEVNIGHCRVHHRHDCTHEEDVGVKCVDWETSPPAITVSTHGITENFVSYHGYNEVRTKESWVMPADKTLAVVLSQVIYIVVAIVVIILLTLKMHQIRRRSMNVNTMAIPLTGREK